MNVLVEIPALHIGAYNPWLHAFMQIALENTGQNFVFTSRQNLVVKELLPLNVTIKKAPASAVLFNAAQILNFKKYKPAVFVAPKPNPIMPKGLPFISIKNWMLHNKNTSAVLPLVYPPPSTNNADIPNRYFSAFISDPKKVDITEILRAFSFFKRRMRSGFSLRFVSNKRVQLPANYDGYKYKSDVYFDVTDDAAIIKNLLQNSFACIMWEGGFSAYFSELMVAGNIPLIQWKFTTQHPLHAAEPEALSALMMALYKDEHYYQKQVADAELLAKIRMPANTLFLSLQVL